VLKFIRRNADALWVKVIFGAIVVVFIGWGIGGGLVGGEKAVEVARVNGETIEPADFHRIYNNMRRVYQDVYKDAFKPEMVKALDLKGKAVDQLIRTSLLRQEAHRLGLGVSEVEVRDAVAAIPSFQQDGRFDKDLYLRILRANGFTPGEFEDSQREQILVDKVQDVITSGVHVSEADARERYRFENEKVNLAFVKFDAPAFLQQVDVTDAEVQAYYDKHQDTLRDPDRVRIEYVQYPADKWLEQADVSDAQIKEYYDAHVDEYSKPEEVHARHILLKMDPQADDGFKAEVRKKADEVLAKVKAGEDFAALAKQYSEDSTAADGGDLGSFGRGKMVKPFEDAAFALAPGATSEIVESPFGLHIIKVESKEEAGTKPLDAVRGEIAAALKRSSARDVARTRAAAGQAKAAAGASLASIAEADGVKVETPPPFSKTEATAALGVGALGDAAFTTEAQAVGAVIDAPPGFYVFRVVEKIPAHVPPLAEIRERVGNEARTEKAAALAKTKADAALAEMATSDLDTVAKGAGLTVDETGPFGRQGPFIPKIGVSPDLKKDAFNLVPEKPNAPAVYSVSGNYFIARLKERLAADEEKFNAEKDTLIGEAEKRLKSQAVEQFVNYLKARATIEPNQDFLASVSDSGLPTDGSPRRRR
jgi:peptidyl-prolyl cis-trans isomerase D